MRARLGVFLVLCVLAASLQAQNPDLAGSVTDSATGLAISGVRVVSLTGSRSTVTDERGRFRLGRVPAGTLAFTRIGYRRMERAGSGSGPVAAGLRRALCAASRSAWIASTSGSRSSSAAWSAADSKTTARS